MYKICLRPCYTRDVLEANCTEWVPPPPPHLLYFHTATRPASQVILASTVMVTGDNAMTLGITGWGWNQDSLSLRTSGCHSSSGFFCWSLSFSFYVKVEIMYVPAQLWYSTLLLTDTCNKGAILWQWCIIAKMEYFYVSCITHTTIYTFLILALFSLYCRHTHNISFSMIIIMYIHVSFLSLSSVPVHF